MDPVPGPSISIGELRPYYAATSSQGKHVLDSVPEPGEWRARDRPKPNIEINADDHLEEQLRLPRRGTGSAKQRAKILDNLCRQNVKISRVPSTDADRSAKGSGLSSIPEEPPRGDPSSLSNAAKGDGSKRQRGDHPPSQLFAGRHCHHQKSVRQVLQDHEMI